MSQPALIDALPSSNESQNLIVPFPIETNDCACTFGELHGERQGKIDDKGVRTYHRRWLAYCPDRLNDAGSVRACFISTVNINIGTAYSTEYTTDTAAKCTDIDVKQDENPWYHYVDLEYSTSADTSRVRIDYSYEPYTKAIEYDIDGDAIVASSGEPFDPAVEDVLHYLVITMTRFETGFDKLKAWDFCDTINKSPWFGFPARTVLLEDIRAHDNGEATARHEVQYSFKAGRKNNGLRDLTGRRIGGTMFNPPAAISGAGPWDLVLLDRGYYKLVGGQRRIITDNGRPLTSPANLDGSGGVLSATAPPVWLTFQVKPERDFTQLNLL